MPGRGYRTPAAGILAAATVLAAALAGCDSHSKPTAVPPLSSTTTSPGGSSLAAESQTPSPSPALSSPIVGASALASAFPSADAQLAAAVETVHEFFDGMNHEIDTGDEAPVSALFVSRCTRCVSGVVNFKNMLRNGDTIRGAHLHLVSVDDAAPTYNDVVTVAVTETEDAGQQLDASGKLIRAFTPVGPTRLIFNLDVSRTRPVIWQIDLVSR